MHSRQSSAQLMGAWSTFVFARSRPIGRRETLAYSCSSFLFSAPLIRLYEQNLLCLKSAGPEPVHVRLNRMHQT